MALFIRQIWTLIVKNLLIALFRRWFSTPFRAFLLPCIFVGFLSYARFLFIPPSVYGIGEPAPVRSLSAALDLVSSDRTKLVFVNSGYEGGDISRVIDEVANSARGHGKDIEILTKEDDLWTACRSTLRGTSNCVAAAVFFSSPTEGPQGRWNYSIRADGALESKIVTNSDTNDVEIYALPLQHAVDYAIAGLNTTVDHAKLPSQVEEYPYTSLTPQQRLDNIRTRYMGGIIDILGVAFFIGMVGVTYQMTGLIASERETGMAQLLDCMMPNTARWQPQMARIVSSHIAFDILYAPGWIVMAIILSVGVFTKTSPAIMIIFNLLSGLAMSSLSNFGAAFFQRAQLSGIISVIVSLLLAVVAQIAHEAGTGSVAILSLLFPPMNYTYFTILMARFEKQDMGTSLIRIAPQSSYSLPGIVFWVFLIIQILVFPVLGALVERLLYGTSSVARHTSFSDSNTAISLSGFTKEYVPTMATLFWSRITRSPVKNVLAVNDLTLEATKGQIVVLLGANGSGKSTTLDAISGLTTITAGTINVNYSHGQGSLGLCPQRNVLWDDLTVEEHVSIFNRVKNIHRPDDKRSIGDLLLACDIARKSHARSKTLSGGQKRKLQLAVMFTGDSSVCCVDEVSSGLDPISRRKIWDILLAERGRRSIILTTHFLDEADLLSDHIAILSKGSLRAEGTAVELKHRLGSGYRVHVYDRLDPPFKHEYQCRQDHDQTIYTVEDSAAAASLTLRLEEHGIHEYQVGGPTIEDVFLKVAEEIKVADADPVVIDSEKDGSKTAQVDVLERPLTKDSQAPPQLASGHRISIPRQAWVLFRKRFTIFTRNYLPYAAAFFIPVVAAGLVTLYLKNFTRAECSPTSTISLSDISSLASQVSYDIVVGPQDRLSTQDLELFVETLVGGGQSSGSTNLTGFLSSLHLVNTLDEFNSYINARFANVTPGGFFLGDANTPSTFAWQGDADISFPIIVQNALDVLQTNISISSQWQAFDLPWGASVGSALLLITYFGLAQSVFPAFFALYPTIERLRNVRALHYSNGVRPAPLWLAYVSFDFLIVLASSVLAIIIFAVSADVWYHIEYLFIVFFLYGLASTLLAYVISLFSRSQLAAFAFAAGGQTVMFLLYYIAFMSVLTYSPLDKIDQNVNIAHFTIASISPVGNLLRGMFLALNVFSITCHDRAYASYPGAITVYGGPILYLTLQSIFLFALLLWWDSGPVFRNLRSKSRPEDIEQDQADPEMQDELSRVVSTQNGLRVTHLSKHFKKIQAVTDVSFAVPQNEVFALLGPNGAGKSTIISLIRGDMQPKPRQKATDIQIDDISVLRHRALARSRLGVCPQFDAMDLMTVREHLTLYARIRGVPNPKHNVDEIMRAVGLTAYADRLAAKLSGGNKRKLSLGMALTGNPSVLLLDEPSSGMDAASKRVMWRTLSSIVHGRSIVLTTHSMEEADALASRAGIMSGRMLALGTTDHLRRRYGDAYYVHLVHRDAPHSSDADMARIREWILANFPGATVEQRTWHGQVRFSAPTATATATAPAPAPANTSADTDDGEFGAQENENEKESPRDEDADQIEEKDTSLSPRPSPSPSNSKSNTARLFALLEANKELLGVEYYSVSQATLDQVFLRIVGGHGVEEEGSAGETVPAPAGEGAEGGGVRGGKRARGARGFGWLKGSRSSG